MKILVSYCWRPSGFAFNTPDQEFGDAVVEVDSIDSATVKAIKERLTSRTGGLEPTVIGMFKLDPDQPARRR